MTRFLTGEHEQADVTHRALTDVDATRRGIYDRVVQAVRTRYPLANERYKLELNGISYDAKDPYDDLAAQKRAILDRRSLRRKLYGSWTLTDKASGKVVDQTDPMVVAHVPVMTNRGTFIHNGHEYTVANQLRLRPGVFARTKENGELESHFNILPHKGPSFRVYVEPETGVFRLRIGQANLKLYPILQGLGLDDRTIERYWGRDVLAENIHAGDATSFKKAVDRFLGGYRRSAGKPGHEPDDAKALLAMLANMELDPEVTRDTLGAPYKTVTPEVILTASKKLLDIRHHGAQPDSRDNMAYQRTYGVEDLLHERIERDASKIGRSLLWRVTNRGNLGALPTGVLTPQLDELFMSSGLAMPLEETNPVEILDHAHRATRLGEGGMPSTDAIPDEARQVQPSYLGYIDPVRAPESLKIGVDMRFSHAAVKGSDGHMYTPMLTPSGRKTLIPPAKATRSVIAFPGEMDRAKSEGRRKVRAMVNGLVRYVSPNKVDYVMPTSEQMFTATSNLIPMIANSRGGRLLMASKMVTQALPLREREAPLVQVAHPDEPGMSFEDKYGDKAGAIRAADNGVVVGMDKQSITVKYADGTRKKHAVYDNFPFNHQTFITSTPVVGIGTPVRRGQVLATSNYTDNNGTLALGANLRVGYTPYRGLSHEDALVISESAARKMASENMYQSSMDADENLDRSVRSYVSQFPSTYSKQVIGNFTADGVVKPGTLVKKDDPLILAVRKSMPRGQGILHRRHKPTFSDAAVTWDRDEEGVVTDVSTAGNSTVVTVKAYTPVDIGDKLSGRFGDKGVVSTIIPDDKMPRNNQGLPMDILVNPLGIISRGNPAQVIEAALGKVARATGKPYKLKGFEEGDRLEYAIQELARNGISDTEDLYDPEADRKIPGVFTGERFYMRLHHLAEDKASGRGDIALYTAEQQPARGGSDGAKRLGNLEFNALIGSGAIEVLRDAKSVRGQRNDDYWRAFRLGYPPPSPNVPFIYRKFLAHLTGAGVNVQKNGDYTHLFALTDKDIDKLSRGEIKKDETVDFEKLNPIKGGLFDIGVTGGHGGEGWSHIQLTEPMPNPVMEDVVRKLLGMTEKEYRDVLFGREQINNMTGGVAIQAALRNINVDQAITAAEQTISSGIKSKRDDAVKQLRYLTMFKKAKLAPADLVLTKVPVIPPTFRPIARLPGKRSVQIVADANLLYRELMMANDNLHELKRELGTKGDVTSEREALYDTFKALVGLGDPVQPKLREKGVSGLLSQVFGGSPKYGMFQRRVIGTPVDFVGRAVITPDPALNMDQVGLPEEKAWVVYRPFIVRRLTRRGMTAMDAVKRYSNRTPDAREALVKEMGERPVIINRAPTLHRYGIMAAWPILTKGDTLRIPPVVCGGFGADFDGDAMQYHVPVSDKAVTETIAKLMPSRNLINPGQFDTQYVPTQEFLQGLHEASTAKTRNPARRFSSKAAMKAAYERGEISLGDAVEIP